MDQDNPAVAAHLRIPPSLLEEVGKDGKLTAEMARKFHFVLLDNMQRRMRDPALPVRTVLDYMEHLAKIGALDAKANAANAAASGPGFSVNIVFKSNEQRRAELAAMPVVQRVDVEPTTPAPPADTTDPDVIDAPDQ